MATVRGADVAWTITCDRCGETLAVKADAMDGFSALEALSDALRRHMWGKAAHTRFGEERSEDLCRRCFEAHVAGMKAESRYGGRDF